MALKGSVCCHVDLVTATIGTAVQFQRLLRCGLVTAMIIAHVCLRRGCLEYTCMLVTHWLCCAVPQAWLCLQCLQQ